MGLSRDDMDRIINEHYGYEARDDVDGVLKTLTDDVAHDVVGFPALVDGRVPGGVYDLELLAAVVERTAQ